MRLEVGIRFDMRAPSWGTSPDRLYASAPEMAAFADAAGIDTLLVGEHHGTSDGYTSAPFVMAASLAARTQRMRVRMRAVLLPLYDPVHFAEQLATLDAVTGGRVEAVLGLGYVPGEFAMFGIEMSDRVRRLEAGIEVLRSLVHGREFSYAGRSGWITPRPVQQPLPLYLGGGVTAAARRAARFGIGFAPHLPDPELIETYQAECVRLGHAPGPMITTPGHYALFVAKDPEQFWRRLEPHALHNAEEYRRMAEGTGTVGPFSQRMPSGGSPAPRDRGPTLVVTPDECIALAQRAYEDNASLQFVPLLGGLDPDWGWSSLQLFASDVLPRLRELGLHASTAERSTT
jgi:alkanesulfonate monooxygenase SsuD/methylene tetrahydromethanopterin reductase-like flavin-dependent oxidoreductase (luciferase family)